MAHGAGDGGGGQVFRNDGRSDFPLNIQDHRPASVGAPRERHNQPGRRASPVAQEDTDLLLIEPSGTPNTDDATTAAPRLLI